MSFSSDEVNFLIYQYLKESNFIHSLYAFASEAKVSESNLNLLEVPTASLINILQKGLQYVEIQQTIDVDGNVIKLPGKLSLLDAAKEAGIKKSEEESPQDFRKNDEHVIDVNDNEIEEVGCSTINIPESCVTTFNGHKSKAYSCAWNPTVHFLASGSSDSTVRIWDVSDNASNQEELIFTHCPEMNNEEIPKNKDITCLDWNRSGKSLAVGTYDGHLHIWTTENSLSYTVGQHNGPIFAVKWNKKGNYLLSGGGDCITRIWQVNAVRKCFQEFCLHSAPIMDIAWKTNDTFASCSADKFIYVCKLSNRRPLKKFEGHTNEINAIEWNPQRKLLASCSDDKTVKVWCMKQDNCVIDFQGHTKEIYTLKWSPTGSGTKNPNKELVLASASCDTTVRLWDVERHLWIRTLTRHTEEVYTMDFSPDGKFLATGGRDKFVYVWSVENGQLVYSFKASAGINDIAWNSIGDRIAVSASDGSVFVLDLRKM